MFCVSWMLVFKALEMAVHKIKRKSLHEALQLTEVAPLLGFLWADVSEVIYLYPSCTPMTMCQAYLALYVHSSF